MQMKSKRRKGKRSKRITMKSKIYKSKRQTIQKRKKLKNDMPKKETQQKGNQKKMKAKNEEQIKKRIETTEGNAQEVMQQKGKAK